MTGRLDDRGTLALAGRARTYFSADALGLQVLVRGTLADRPALRARLGIDPARRPSDGELLAHAFRTWGRELQCHVAGEYAAVIVDPRAVTALLTHDALGLAPLFYTNPPGALAFSTHLLDLVDATAAAALDEEYLADVLAQGVVATERTPYAAIRRLLPGRSLWWSNAHLRELRTWNLADVPPLRCRDDAEYEARFRALLGAGVQAALGATGTAWSDLSGGLDSSSVTSVAAAAGAPGLAALSIVAPDYPEIDERRWMRAVVERYDLAWHQLDVAAMLPFARLPDEFLGEPTATVIEAEQLRVHRELLESHGVTTLLTGHGGDAVLAASPGPIASHLADALFEGRPLAALRAVRAWGDGSRERRSQSYWLLRSLAEPTVNHLRGRPIRSSIRLPVQAWLDAGWVRRMRPEQRVRGRLAPPCRQPGRQHLADSLWAGALSMSTAAQRRQAFDVRSPLLYRPLVEFMCAIPWEQKLQPRCDRYLQRRALAGVLPELVRRRASKGDGSRTLVEGLSRSRTWQAYLTDDPLLAKHGIADAARWRHAVKQAALGETHGDQFFLAGVAVEAWLRQLEDHRSTTSHRTEWAIS